MEWLSLFLSFACIATLAAGLGGLLCGGLSLLRFFTYRRAQRDWQSAAARLRLTHVGRFRLLRPPETTLTGELHGVAVQIRSTLELDRREHVSLYVRPSAIRPSLFVGPATARTRLDRALRGPGVRLGIPGFDEEVHLEGPEAEFLGLLDAGTRARVVALTRGCGGRVENGEVRVDLPPGAVAPGELVARVWECVELAERLAEPGPPLVARLLERVREDPEPALRRRSLELLLERFPGTPEAQAGLAGGREDRDPSVRVLAAERSGEAGWALLRALAESGDLPSERALVLLRGLAVNLPVERLLAHALDAFGSRHPGIQRLGIELLGRLRYGPALEGFLGRLAQAGTDAETAAELAQALGELGDARAEAALISQLARPEAGVRKAAALALARVGGIAALAPLVECRRGQGFFGDADLAAAVRAALAAIRERVGPGLPGQLSLAQVEDEAGALSLATAAGAGALSNATEEEATLERARRREPGAAGAGVTDPSRTPPAGPARTP